MSYTVNRTYVDVKKSDGTWLSFAGGRGMFQLASGTTYYFILPVGASVLADVHLTHDDAIVITTATLEVCGHAPSEVDDVSTLGGEWIAQGASNATVAVDGANTSATDAVVTTTGGAAGGAQWSCPAMTAPRERLAVVVGATGGAVRLSFTGKE